METYVVSKQVTPRYLQIIPNLLKSSKEVTQNNKLLPMQVYWRKVIIYILTDLIL